ncbi:wall-associated receptor kinase-like 10 isoform X2, partial [Fagus crenata]
KNVLEISLEGTVRVNYSLSSTCIDNITLVERDSRFLSSPFSFSRSRNVFVALGCNIIALLNSLEDDSVIGGCANVCNQYGTSVLTQGSGCRGYECCQATIPSDLDEKLHGSSGIGMGDK